VAYGPFATYQSLLFLYTLATFHRILWKIRWVFFLRNPANKQRKRTAGRRIVVVTASKRGRKENRTWRGGTIRRPAGDDAGAVPAAADWARLNADRTHGVGHSERTLQPDERQVAGQAAPVGAERPVKHDAVDSRHLGSADVVAVQVDRPGAYRQSGRIEAPRSPARSARQQPALSSMFNNVSYRKLVARQLLCVCFAQGRSPSSTTIDKRFQAKKLWIFLSPSRVNRPRYP